MYCIDLFLLISFSRKTTGAITTCVLCTSCDDESVLIHTVLDIINIVRKAKQRELRLIFALADRERASIMRPSLTATAVK
jgi:hypothetical protein